LHDFCTEVEKADITNRLNWILNIPERFDSNPFERVRNSFERYVDARKETVKCFVEVGKDLQKLDQELKKKKAWSTAASVAGNR
jgi:hypothetical protein